MDSCGAEIVPLSIAKLYMPWPELWKIIAQPVTPLTTAHMHPFTANNATYTIYIYGLSYRIAPELKIHVCPSKVKYVYCARIVVCVCVLGRKSYSEVLAVLNTCESQSDKSIIHVFALKVFFFFVLNSKQTILFFLS